MVHPYFQAKAEEQFAKAGGDPALAGPLAEWAEAAKKRTGVQGVIVAEDGEILAETILRGRSPDGVRAAYVVARDGHHWDLRSGTVVDKAVAQIARQEGKRVIHLTTSQLTRGAGAFIRRPSTMTGAEFRAILEQIGYAEEDAARALGKSRSMIQKMRAGTAPIQQDTADAVERLQDEYADAVDTVLAAAPEEIEVWRDDETSWAQTGRPARWHRMIAAHARQAHGTKILYRDTPPSS